MWAALLLVEPHQFLWGSRMGGSVAGAKKFMLKTFMCCLCPSKSPKWLLFANLPVVKKCVLHDLIKIDLAWPKLAKFD